MNIFRGRCTESEVVVEVNSDKPNVIVITVNTTSVTVNNAFGAELAQHIAEAEYRSKRATKVLEDLANEAMTLPDHRS